MAKAFLLMVGVLAYLAVTHYAYDLAQAQTIEIKKFYTSGLAQASDISTSNR
jgi:hypothetical protein